MSHTYDFPVDRTTIMLFSSALGETNRIYYDEDYAARTPLGGVIAPPTFPTASNLWNPTYYLRGIRRIPEPVASRESPPEGEAIANQLKPDVLGRALHAEMHYEFHRPVRPGMRLRVTTRPGRTWNKTGRRGGQLRFVETIIEYRDKEHEPVVTARSVSVYTSRPVEPAP